MPRKSQIHKLSFLSLIAAMIGVMVFPTSVMAAITDGRGGYGVCGTQMMRAYFADVCGTPYTDANGDDGFVMPRRYVSGVLQPALYGIDTKLELYNYLIGGTGLGSGSEQSRVGAAFIIHTLLGRSGDQANANGGKAVSATDQNLLYQALVQNSDISISIGLYSNRYNSGSRVVSGRIDESFFDGAMGGGAVANVSSLILRKVSTGQILYVLERSCANPMGWGMPGLDMPWTTVSDLHIIKQSPVAGGPYANVNNAQPGEQYAFRYTLRNQGPGSTTRSISIQQSINNFPANAFPIYSPYSTRAAGYGAWAFLYQDAIVANTGPIPASAGGQNYCVAMRSAPTSLINPSWLYSPQPCVYVPYNYSLRGATAVPGGQAIAAGDTVGFTHTMTNTAPSGVPTYSEPTTYTIMQFILPPAGTYDSVDYHDNGPAPGAAVCVGWISGACASAIYTGASTRYAPGSIPITGGPDLTAAQTNLAPGSRICRLVVIARAAPGVNNRWDVPRCVTVGKKPYTTIMNGDGWAGGSFSAISGACSIAGLQAGGFTGDYTTYSADGNEYGSFGEYQLFGIGPISSFGSAGRPATAAGTPSVNMTYRGPTTLGYFYTSSNPVLAPNGTSKCLNDALQNYASTPKIPYGAAVFNPTTVASGVYTYAGNLTISPSGDMAPGKRIVLIVSGRVTITGNIRFAAGPYANLADMPSFTLIAAGPAASNNNIEVRQGVTQLDGIYQTYDEFHTCYEFPYTGGLALSHNICQEQLVINGSVTANKFVLRRIKGADPAPALRNIPAEVFNLRSDVYLNAYGNAQGGRQIRTVSEKELPPRY